MDKFNEAVSLRSKAVTRLADGAGFFRHMARQYPDAFDARAGRFAMGLAVAVLRQEAETLTVEAMSDDAGDLGVIKGIVAYHIQNWPGSDGSSVVWTGDGAGSTVLPHFRAMRLTARLWLTPRLCRLTLEGPDLHRFARGGWHVRLLLPADSSNPVWPYAGPGALPIWPQGADRLALRTYTLRHVRPDRGEVDIDVVMHQPAGRMTDWVSRAALGDPIGMMGPGGGEVPEVDHVCLAGDETALPAIARALERLPAGARGHAFIEVGGRDDEMSLQKPAGVDVRWVHRMNPAGLCDALQRAVAELDWPGGQGSLYAFSGTEFVAYKALRHEFRKRRALKRNQHLAMSYWRRGIAESA
ncbi:NADPH-dependent ferric siderophore reductase, contains FAD-binding and SIP domains [Aureimonas altamirensis DSM 21988]|uniref:NADPH-dependent ferric siderophore reductase, contains FAD-binding and SIP domains n=1 Tax=Aureimonas altamirensis DSM 21988 TaxID=1121026 RepID=A0ABY1INA6_9HYPH|nr:siderophore-interacting protein [Aureimonas altamirensis]SHJ55829.1 NADPH-dependent ferric siderophore reductase, contains FAD-binding and SIP domains [Aureimonas altamirensis DSM 21988]